jgi:hypothetical protein
MKTISTLILFIFISLQSFSQTLEGEWRGSYDIVSNSPYPSVDMPITLYFVLNKDSSYTIFSYSWGRDKWGDDTIVVCQVLYKMTSANSIYLEETQVLRPEKAKPACFQKMYLNIRREDKLSILEGTWKSENKCNSSGKIKFIKKG